MVEIAPRSGLRSASLVEQVELARLQANSQIDGHVRGALGQFMTPAAVARLMAALLVCDTPHVALLDAGAGVGSLSSAVVEALICRELPPVSLHIAAYEIDPLLAAHLRKQWSSAIVRARMLVSRLRTRLSRAISLQMW